MNKYTYVAIFHVRRDYCSSIDKKEFETLEELFAFAGTYLKKRKMPMLTIIKELKSN